MIDNDLTHQLEDVFSDITPEPDETGHSSLHGGIVADLLEGEVVTKPGAAEPSISDTPFSMHIDLEAEKNQDGSLLEGAYVSLILVGLLLVSLLIGFVWPTFIALSDLRVLYLAVCVVVLVGTVIQWKLNSSLTVALRKAEAERTKAVFSQTRLEERVQELIETNALLEQHTLQSERASQISRALNATRELDKLMQEAVNLICDLFDLYYVGVFTIDESEQWAVLRCLATSPGAGQTGGLDHPMLVQGYRREVEGASTVSRCIANSRVVIARDCDEEAYHHTDTLLPGARSEMTLFLQSGGRPIGALDLQSSVSQAFSQYSIDVFRMMVDQLALAIDNAQMFAELEARLEMTKEFQPRYEREQQPGFILDPAPSLYECTRSGVAALGDEELPEIEQAMAQRELMIRTGASDDGDHAALVMPIALRGEVMGALGFHEEHRRRWTVDEIALVEDVTTQVALAVENARLFEKTQAALAETEALYGASHRITISADLPTLYQVLVGEMANRLGADQCQLTIFNWKKGYGEIVAGYHMPDADKAPIPMNDCPGYLVLRNTRKPVAINDVSTHPAFLNHKDALADKNVNCVLLVPIVVRGELIGSLEIGYADGDRSFREAELDFCQTLAGQAAITIDNIRAFEEQRETAERLREMDKLKTQFLANMSHELRTPLNSIIGFSRVILKGIDGPLTEMQETDLIAIYNSGQHLLGLINDILDLSKIEAGKMELNFEEVDLKPIIKGVMSSAVGLVKDKSIELEQQVPDDLPNIWADATRIRQVLLNLISNSTKFTEEGRICLTAGYDGEWVIIDITDTGVGISEEKLESIFEEFTQVDGSTTRSVGGTGLGLPISRRFIEMHGGKITVKSEVGVGSTFSVWVPTYAQMEPTPERVEPQSQEEYSTVERRLVLAVDDDPGVISLYRRYLESDRYQVVGATHSEEVLDKAAELQPFAITLDVLMPDKDGWQVLRELKACSQTQHIPIIICSIVSNEGLGFSLGAADYLVKPITEKELLAALSRLDRRQEEDVEVLVIDDQADDILLIRRMLEAQRNYRVIEADGGQTGIDMVHQCKPNLIILDLMMPEVDGFAVLEALKREPDTRDIPVIVITAKELTEAEQQQLKGQVEVLLHKGLFTEQELLEDLGKALSQIESCQPDV